METGGTGTSVTENFNTEEIGSGDFILTDTDFPTEVNSAVIVIPEGDDAPDWLLLYTGRLIETIPALGATGPTHFDSGSWHWIRREMLLGKQSVVYGDDNTGNNSLRITDTIDATDGDVFIGWVDDTANNRKLLILTSDNAAHNFYGVSLRKPVSIVSGLIDGFYSTTTKLDSAFIHDGSVSNAAFGHLANVTSDIQAQISRLTGGSSSGVQFVSEFPETPSNEDVAVFYENNVQTPATDAIPLGQRLSSGDIDLSSLSQIASITGFKIGPDNKAYLVNTASEEVIIVDRDSSNGFSSTSPVTTFSISPSANFSRGLTIDSNYAYILSDRYMHAFSLTSNPIGAETTSRRYQFAGSIGARGGADVRNDVFWSARSIRTECDIEKFSWDGSSYTSNATYTIPNLDANGLAFDGNYVFVLLKNGPTHSITVRNPSDFTEVTTIALPSGIANPTGLTVHNGILYVYEGSDNIAYAFAAAAQDAAEEVAQLAGDVYRYNDTAMDWNKLGSVAGKADTGEILWVTTGTLPTASTTDQILPIEIGTGNNRYTFTAKATMAGLRRGGDSIQTPTVRPTGHIGIMAVAEVSGSVVGTAFMAWGPGSVIEDSDTTDEYSSHVLALSTSSSSNTIDIRYRKSTQSQTGAYGILLYGDGNIIPANTVIKFYGVKVY